MGRPIVDKNRQIDFLEQRLQTLYKVLEAIDPTVLTVADIDHLMDILDDIEAKCSEFKNRT
ncbi:hypothetical protein J9303_03205 [Bacillaceae bacterium Marseille-Q3522]|nr:hypothetical protein [Bacillaceae bacterium Marseille-Q3522]